MRRREKGDKLRARCQELLAPGENIVMEAEAAGWIGPINVLGTGRAYLMDRRFIWIRRATPLIRPLLFWVPEVIEIELTRIERITLVREWWRAWLEIRSGGRQYRFRLGQGPYPFLKDNPRTTQQWFEEIDRRRQS